MIVTITIIAHYLCKFFRFDNCYSIIYSYNLLSLCIVHADISVHSGSASIEVEVTCTIGYISDIILINSINLNEELSRNISCSTERKSESTTFHDLDCEREYNISLTSYYWSYCIVSSTEQPVTASPLCRSPKNLTGECLYGLCFMYAV